MRSNTPSAEARDLGRGVEKPQQYGTPLLAGVGVWDTSTGHYSVQSIAHRLEIDALMPCYPKASTYKNSRPHMPTLI